MKSKLLLIILTAFLCLHSKAETASKAAPKTPKIKVACVGNSITAGAGIKNRDKDSYPMMLGQMLGKNTMYATSVSAAGQCFRKEIRI